MNGFELDLAMRKILTEARPETCLSATAALVRLGFPALASFRMVEAAIRNNPSLKEQHRGNETHDPSAHSELPGEEPRPDRVADQPGHQEVGRPRVRGARQRRAVEEGQRVTQQGSARRARIRRVQSVAFICAPLTTLIRGTQHIQYFTPAQEAFENAVEQVTRGLIVSCRLTTEEF